MRLQKPLFLFIFIAITLVGISLTITPVNNVQAQCKNVSSCKNCHEIQGTFSVANKGLWHSQHALYDFCDVCHGGDKASPDKLNAHGGIKTTFSDLTQSCTNCHASDLDKRIKTYSDVLGVRVQVPFVRAACTPTPGFFQGADLFTNHIPQIPESTLQAQSSGSQPPTGQIGQVTPIVNKTGNLILKVLLGLMIIGGFIFIYLNEKYHFMPSNKVREVLAQSVKPIIDREAIARKIDQLSPKSQLELERLLNDPAQAEQILRNLNKDIDE